MSKTTLRKRIALTATTALFAGMLSVASAPVASSAIDNGTVNSGANALITQASDTTTYVATLENTTGGAVAAMAAADAVITTGGVMGVNFGLNAKSTRLLAKSTSTGTAQTATMLVGGTLSIYSLATTSTAFVVSAGTLSGATATAASAATYADPATVAFLDWAGAAASAATNIAVLWTAPTTAGTYTISKYYSSATAEPALATPTNGTLGGQITVTVVAASAGSTYSAAYSLCQTKDAAATQILATTADSTTSFKSM